MPLLLFLAMCGGGLWLNAKIAWDHWIDEYNCLAVQHTMLCVAWIAMAGFISYNLC